MTVRRTAGAAGLACAAVLASGCGGPAAGTSAGAAPADAAQVRAVTNAADTLGKAGSAKVSSALRTASGGTWVTITGTGGFDFARRQGELVLLLPKDAVGKEEHKPITELMTPGALYMKNRGAGVPAGKWVRVDTTRIPDGNLVTGGATEPLAAAELLRGAEDVTYAGTVRMQGVQVRHFRGTTDIARAARTASPAVRGPLAAAARGFTVTRVPFDAWLDPQGRLRKLSEQFTMTVSGSGTAAAKDGTGAKDTKDAQGAARNVMVVSTTTYDAFGTPVAVTMPGNSDIWTGKIVSAQP
ncbi:hypothetical protein [Actinacidiphila yanglinensis]|uniref:hypothetical protein n=1 Tax=Actinacidiphila yanglinensis TaxID=310779 RepID=UPI000CDEA7A2|nr:hypothetical protein [Actinacidiphila yanglinensis]